MQADFGVQRHYRSSEYIYVLLQTPAGVAFTGGTLAAGSIRCTLSFPDGTTKDKHTSPPANSLLELGNGLYRITLWGSGQSSGVDDVDLAQVGRVGVIVYSNTGAFETVAGHYDVRPDWKPKLAVTYLPGPSGSDQISGAITINRWWSNEKMLLPISGTPGITSLTLRISDKDSVANLLNLSVGAGELVENTFDSAIYFAVPIAGVTGGRVLLARLSGTYKGSTISEDFLLPARRGA